MSNIRDAKTKRWINSKVFREEAQQFLKNNYYINAPFGTPDWLEYWTEQLRRCKEGYGVLDDEGNYHKITGNHYFYLNFTQIQIVNFGDEDDETSVAEKVTMNPDLWDGDYDYFWSLEIARHGICTANSPVPTTQEERTSWNALQKQIRKLAKEIGYGYKNTPEYKELKEARDKISLEILDRLGLKVKPHLDYLDGGYHMIVGKSRRKGYSYKDGAICANVYNTQRGVQIIIGAFEKKFLYPNGTMGMTSNYLNFLNEHTGWAKARLIDKQDHKKSGYIEAVNGMNLEKGYKSEVFALTFKDNPDAARGKDAKLVLLEEAGAFPNLKDSFNAIVPALTAGSFITGQIIIFGTGGDMESGTVDYADMFYNPVAYRLMPFVNIWDENAENTTCGFFHPVTWNMEGFYDEMGNSDIEGATEFEINRRKEKMEAASSSVIVEKHVQEYPFCPSEAFLTVNTNTFPVIELRAQLNRVKAEKLHLSKGTPVFLSREEGKVVAKPDLKNELKPIYDYKVKQDDITGCTIIFEYPVDNAPKGLYKIGFDPYSQDEGTSLAAIYVYKSVHSGTYTNNIIVAEFVGRPQEADDVSRIASLLGDLYNAEIMHENEVSHVKNYFRRVKRLDQLAVQPDAVISKNVKNSKVARVYGMHMNEQLKDAGEKYIKDWLLEVRDYDEDGNAILNLETIYSVGLLEELIGYNRKGNFDRIMAFMQVMFQCQEEELGKDYKGAQESRVSSLLNALDKMFGK